MKIQYYMQFFPGKSSPGSQQPVSLVTFLAQRGHEVSVISADYNYDTGKKEETAEIEFDNGGKLRIIRLPSLAGGRGSLSRRLISYVHFMVVAYRTGCKLAHPDVIIGSIQPMFTGWAALRVAKRTAIPFLLEVRDLWPDALTVKRAIRPWQARPLHWIVHSLYEHADRIVSITPGIQQELLKKEIPADKIDVFPNGFDPRLFDIHRNTRNAVRDKYGWNSNFVAIYTGSFQDVTAVEVIVRAAEQLRGRRNIRFEIFGGGPTKNTVVKLAQSLQLDNVVFHEPVPKKEIPGLLAAADVALMCLFKTPLSHIYFENKFLDYMGAGKPILAAMEGEQARLIQKHNTGCVVPSLDHQHLANLIAAASENFQPFAVRGANGQKLVWQEFLLPEILQRYATTIENVAGHRQCRPDVLNPVTAIRN